MYSIIIIVVMGFLHSNQNPEMINTSDMVDQNWSLKEYHEWGFYLPDHRNRIIYLMMQSENSRL